MLGCVPPLGRRSAGNLVHQRVLAFSAALLEAETACFAAVDRRFGDYTGNAEVEVRVSWRRTGGRPASSAQLRDELAALATAALEACRPAVTRLLRIGTDLALEAIADELGYCEAALPARYAGSAAVGVEAAEQQTAALTDAAAAGCRAGEPAALLALDAGVRQQLTLSAGHAEPLQVLLARVIRPQPGPGTPGLTGRGVWWRPAGEAKAAARAAVIGLTNAVREAAMAGMNTALTAT